MIVNKFFSLYNLPTVRPSKGRFLSQTLHVRTSLHYCGGDADGEDPVLCFYIGYRRESGYNNSWIFAQNSTVVSRP
jgi:hypothetical protein